MSSLTDLISPCQTNKTNKANTNSLVKTTQTLHQNQNARSP